MGNHVDRCIVTVTEEQSFPVEQIEIKLRRHYDIVHFMALGTPSFVDYHGSKYNDSVSPINIDTSFYNHHLVISSLKALLELGSSIKYFKNVTFWFDPTDLYGTKLQHQKHNNQSAVDLICSTICEALTQTSASGLIARTESGKLEWMQAYGINVPLVLENFVTEYTDTSCEPLIEKRDQLRFLIDASNSSTTISLVEPFLVLQEFFKDIELWCNYNGELPLWMRPDFLIQEIPSIEAPLYTNSIDALVAVGKSLDQRKTIQYLALGFVPIVIDEQLGEELGTFIDTTAIKASFPSFGSENLLHELAESPEKLQLYNSYSKTDLKNNLLFDSNIISSNSVSIDSCVALLNSTTFNNSRELYLESSYGDPAGTSLHRALELTSAHLGSVKAHSTNQVILRGWCLNTETLTEAEVLTYIENTDTPSIIRRKDRADVADAFKLEKHVPVGFESHTIVRDEHSTDQIKLVIADKQNKLAKLDAFDKDLQAIVDLEELEKHHSLVKDTTRFRGVLESIEIADIKGFDLTKIETACEEIILKFKNKDEFLSINSVEFYLSSDKQLQLLSSDCVDESAQTLTVSVSKDNSHCTLYVRELNIDECIADEITCHAYYTKADFKNALSIKQHNSPALSENTPHTTLEI